MEILTDAFGYQHGSYLVVRALIPAFYKLTISTTNPGG